MYHNVFAGNKNYHWNNISVSVIQAGSVNAFKSLLFVIDQYRRLTMVPALTDLNYGYETSHLGIFY